MQFVLKAVDRGDIKTIVFTGGAVSNQPGIQAEDNRQEWAGDKGDKSLRRRGG